MIILVHALRRRPDLSREMFAAHWRDIHAPLVRSLAGRLGIRRYVQLHAASEGAAFDGLAQVWVDSRSALKARLETPEGQEVASRIRADEEHFIDLSRTATLWASEHLIFGT